MKWSVTALAFAGQASLAVAQPAAPAAKPVADPAKVMLPDLNVATTAGDADDFDKYYYFHRPDTPFEVALSDIRECDGYARGLASPYGYYDGGTMYNSSLTGVAGGLIANALVSAIFGSAELRKARRANMRRCMNYKGYDRYGLPKDVWKIFNFEEGFSSVEEKDRQVMLAQQAKAASGARPNGKVLGR